MIFPTEKYVSNFIQSQFPFFYEEDGPAFIAFVEAYYEWLESQKDPDTGVPNIIGATRNFMDYNDIDNTLDEFLSYFQQKYLYGIPFNIIVNKRFLLKHVLDIYRSKGSLQCFKLLFRLIYNEDVEVYLPKNDIIKSSDGTWTQPVYLEVSNNGNLQNYVGKSIIGINSGVTAIVENVIREKINNYEVCTFYLSNINPPSLSFIKGETVIVEGVTDAEEISSAPIVVGSLYSLSPITNGGENFSIGDILKIADHDLASDQVSSRGVDGLLKITQLTSTKGNIHFSIDNPGTGYSVDSDIFLYNSSNNIVNQASFKLGALGYQQNISFNTDMICDYANVAINANSYGFPGNPTSNLNSVINQTLTYQTKTFGSITSLSNIVEGNNYLTAPFIFVSSTLESNKFMDGTISFSSNSNIVTGNGTFFSTVMTSNSVISLYSNTSFKEKQVVKSVDSNTQITLYGNPKTTSSNGLYKPTGIILPSNIINDNSNNTIGKNAVISGTASYGNNNAFSVVVIDSGRGYQDNEEVSAYLYNSLGPVVIANGGINYANGESLNFIGSGSTVASQGKIITDNKGTIVNVTYNIGSNHKKVPTINVNTKNGQGAILTTSINQYNSNFKITGLVTKSGMGKSQGYWSTSRGFLNSDKYIQDDYFYQTYSYQIKTAALLKDYKDILYKTFHTTGTEMFGQYYSVESINQKAKVLQETILING